MANLALIADSVKFISSVTEISSRELQWQYEYDGEALKL